MDVTTYGLDVAKAVFQLYSFDAETGKVSNRKLAKQQLIELLAREPASRIALEAYGSAHCGKREQQAEADVCRAGPRE
jgi:hypothetical protein